jgi:osmotically-inducible protein OsmY
MKKLFYVASVCLISFYLQGCLLFAAGAGAATTAAVVHDHRTLQTITDDQNIEFTADNQINQDATLRKDTHIVVISFNHAVLLVGQVPDDATRTKVQAMVQALPKVTRVYNQLTVSPPTAPEVRSNDVWITAKVKTQMVSTKNLHSGQIKVVTENGTVYLMGIVTKPQANMASDVARRVNGVKSVVMLFEYTYG